MKALASRKSRGPGKNFKSVGPPATDGVTHYMLKIPEDRIFRNCFARDSLAGGFRGKEGNLKHRGGGKSAFEGSPQWARKGPTWGMPE